MTCASCGQPLGEGARFCASCGAPVQRLYDERRVVTVLFADLVGFTALSESRDPEQVKHLIDGCFERLVADITEFGGRVDKIVGDGILALFGAPTAHEDDAERAVRAALRMQRTLAQAEGLAGGGRLQLRTGLNTGEVLVGALRAGGDYTAMGDVVNIAQRLQTAAAPGQIVVGPTTYAATRHAVRYEHLGLVHAKGRGEPVDAWIAEEAVLPPGARPGRGLTPMVGRDHELGILRGAITNGCVRQRAQLVLVMAEAGMGKTRLAEEAACHAELEHGVSVLEGRCVPYGEANVWWPVAEALRTSCELAVDASVEVATERLTGMTRWALPDESEIEVGRVTKGLLHLMGYEGTLRGIDPGRAREEVVRSLLSVVEGFARQRPVVVLFSDLHWADLVVLELADTLLDRLAGLPFVLIGTARHSLLERWQPKLGRHNQLVLNLDPLSREAAGELLDAMVPQPLAADLREVLLNRSGGNPFFLEELVSLVLESSLNDPGTTRPAEELPHTLRGLVAARLDGLSADERCVLEDAAVLGRRGTVNSLELMSEHAHAGRSIDTAAAVAGLVDKDVLVVEDCIWRFRSDLVREVAYSMLTKADRAERHNGVAKWMEHHGKEGDDVERIAHHYGMAASLLQELGSASHPGLAETPRRAALWLGRAVDRAEESELYLEVDRLSALALSLDGVEGIERRHFLRARARAGIGKRDLTQAAADVVMALAEAEADNDARGIAKAMAVRGELEQKSGDLDASARTLADALERFRAIEDRRGEAGALRSLGMTALFAERTEQALDAFHDALGIFRDLGDRRGEGWALQNLAWVAYQRGEIDQAETWLASSADTFAEIGDAGGLGWAMGLTAFVRYHQGRYDEAEGLAEAMLAEAVQRGDKWAEGMMGNLLGMVALWSGRSSRALEMGKKTFTLFRSIGDWFGFGVSVGVVARSLTALGRIDEAFALIDEVLTIDPETALGIRHDMAVTAKVTTSAQAGTPERLFGADGEELVLADLAWVDQRIAMALLGLQRGQVDEPRAALESAAATGSTAAVAALAVARAAAGDFEGAREAAIQVGSSEGATYADRVQALLGGGLAAAAGGDYGVGAAMLRTAQELVDATEDVLLGMTVRLAEARLRECAGHTGAHDDIATARRALAAMGVAEPGWDVVFRSVLSRAPRPVEG